jgi:hypothetical protein
VKQLLIANKPQVVYLAPGTYEVGSTINLRTDTILMGDATDVSMPVPDFPSCQTPTNTAYSLL